MGLAQDLAPFSESLGVDADFAFPHGIVDLGPRGLRGRAWWPLDVDARPDAMSRGPRDLSTFVPDGLDEARVSEETVDDLERLAAPQPHHRRSDRRHARLRDRRSALGVSVALVVDGRPIAGVVHAPALDETYAAARGGGRDVQRRAARRLRRAGRRGVAAGPKPVVEAMAAELGAPVEIVPRVPSLAYRLCLAARGAVDFAVAAGNSHDWDIAARRLLLEEAGARLIDASGERLRYNSARGPPRRAPCCAGRGRAPADRGLSRRHRARRQN